MKCLVTGASSGIGKDMCKYLSKLGHEVIMVSSDRKKLEEASKLIENSRVYVADLSKEKEVDKLLEFIMLKKPEIVINDAGFGAFGSFDQVSNERELEMIKVNVVALQRITATCLKYMVGLKESYILNVASIAGLMPGGPLLNTYYATKNYVRSYTLAIYEELRRKKSNVNISVLCPGPVTTNFNNVAGVSFSLKSLTSEYVARYAIDNMLNKKLLIIPGFRVKVGYIMGKILPVKTLLKILYKSQRKKLN